MVIALETKKYIEVVHHVHNSDKKNSREQSKFKEIIRIPILRDQGVNAFLPLKKGVLNRHERYHLIPSR